MKKKIIIFLIVIIVIVGICIILYKLNIIPHKYYYNKDFNIETYISSVDKDNDGIDDQTDILNNVRNYIATKPKYKSKYYGTGYPDDEYGVCVDVVAFGLKDAGYDLMELVNEDVKNNREKSLYFSFKEALKNMERGQTPYTPAVTILLQLHKRLFAMKEAGGILAEQKKIHELAEYFRNHLVDLPLDFLVEHDKDRSNAVTALKSHHHKAEEIFERLKKEYSIWICPNGGKYKDDIFRVGHIGCLKKRDYDLLLDALREINAKGYM